jgi:hypothetical protein
MKLLPLSVLLSLLLIGCAASQLSAARNLSPISIAADSAPVCPTAPVVMCVAVTATPGSGLVTATPNATALATSTPRATATETLWPTPTQIVQGATLTPAPPVRYGLYTPNFQQRVRLCGMVSPECPQTAWIGGGTTWAVWSEGGSASGDLWLMIEDKARGISGWVAYRYQGVLYGTYRLDNH